MKKLLFMALCLCNLGAYAGDKMDQNQLEEIVKSMAESAKGQKGTVAFVFEGMEMYLLSDTNYDRMRIISPIAEFENLTEGQVNLLMESNFHSALDARYAVSDGILYSAYIHPLSKLDTEQVQSAVIQVFNLKVSFGSSYSSGTLNYDGGIRKQPPADKIKGNAI